MCPDAPAFDFAKYSPDDHENFSCFLELLIGPEKGLGEESFQLMIYTPRWLQEHIPEDGVFICRRSLVVAEFNRPQIISWLNRHVERCSSETWEGVVKRLSYIADWEFDSYQE